LGMMALLNILNSHYVTSQVHSKTKKALTKIRAFSFVWLISSRKKKLPRIASGLNSLISSERKSCPELLRG